MYYVHTYMYIYIYIYKYLKKERHLRAREKLLHAYTYASPRHPVGVHKCTRVGVCSDRPVYRYVRQNRPSCMIKVGNF